MSQWHWKTYLKLWILATVLMAIFPSVSWVAGLVILVGLPVLYFSSEPDSTRVTAVPNDWNTNGWFALVMSGIASVLFLLVTIIISSMMGWVGFTWFTFIALLLHFAMVYGFVAAWDGVWLVIWDNDQLQIASTNLPQFLQPQEQIQAVEPPRVVTQFLPPAQVDLYGKTLGFEFLAGTWRAGQVIKYGAFLFMPFVVLLFAVGLLGTSYDAGSFFNAGAGLQTFGGGWLIAYVLVVLLFAVFHGYWGILNSLMTWHRWDDDVNSDELKLVEGAREIAKHTPEFEKIKAAHAEIASRSGGKVREPSGWVIIESELPNTYTIGQLIFLTRGAINSPHLSALMAHELGHLQQEDGEILLALRRFVANTVYMLGVDSQPSGIGSVAGNASTMVVTTDSQKFYYQVKARELQEDLAWKYGGLGMLRLGALWADFWRLRDFAADSFVFQLGMAEHLIAALNAYSSFDVVQPYRTSGRPYAAERIEALRQKIAEQKRAPKPTQQKLMAT